MPVRIADDPGVRVARHRRARRAAVGPLRDHPLEIGDQQVGRRLQVGGPPVAVAAGAGVARRVVGPGPVAGARPGAVQVLPPEQELDRVVAGGDVRLDRVRLLQRVLEQRRA